MAPCQPTTDLASRFARWLSAPDLKELALFGCPCLESKTVFAAKALRKFFEIPEQEVAVLTLLWFFCVLSVLYRV